MKTRALPPELRAKIDPLWTKYDAMAKHGHVDRLRMRDEIEEVVYQLGYDVGRVASGQPTKESK